MRARTQSSRSSTNIQCPEQIMFLLHLLSSLFEHKYPHLWQSLLAPWISKPIYQPISLYQTGWSSQWHIFWLTTLRQTAISIVEEWFCYYIDILWLRSESFSYYTKDFFCQIKVCWKTFSLRISSHFWNVSMTSLCLYRFECRTPQLCHSL